MNLSHMAAVSQDTVRRRSVGQTLNWMEGRSDAQTVGLCSLSDFALHRMLQHEYVIMLVMLLLKRKILLLFL